MTAAMVVVGGCGGVPKKEEWRRRGYVRRERGKARGGLIRVYIGINLKTI